MEIRYINTTRILSLIPVLYCLLDLPISAMMNRSVGLNLLNGVACLAAKRQIGPINSSISGRSIITGQLYIKSRLPRLLLGSLLLFWTISSAGQVSGDSSPVPADQSEQMSEQVSRPLNITFDEGNISVDIEGAALRDVLSQLSRLSGIKVGGTNQAGHSLVNERFSTLPTEKALQRLLGETNYLLIYEGGEGKGPVTALYLFPPGTDSAVQTREDALYEMDPAVLLDGLKDDALPPGMKALMLADRRAEIPAPDNIKLRVDALTRLLGRLGPEGSAESPTALQLREHLRNLEQQLE